MLAAPLFAILVLGRQTPQHDFAKAWTEVADGIRSRYYARTTRKDDMERFLSEEAPKAKAAKSDAEFSADVNEMIDKFKDSHFGLFTREDQGYYVMEGLVKGSKNASDIPQVGAFFKPASGGYAIRILFEDGAAQKANLRKGDVVTFVDGQPFSPVDSLREKVGKKVTLAVKRGDLAFTREVEVGHGTMLDAFLDASRASGNKVGLRGRFGYFHLWTQVNDDFKNALAGVVYGKLKDTDAFILDLRDGFGGRPEGFADPFFRPEVNIEWNFGQMTQHELFGYGRPLVVLINEGSRSAKEVLAYILQHSKRATLIGSRTAGNVLGTSPIAIGDWAYLEVPLVDVVTNGVRLEHNGVKPDIEVPVEIGPDGDDLVIKRAIDYLEKTVSKKAA